MQRMLWLVFLLMLVVLAACAGDPVSDSRPVLVSEVTLGPPTQDSSTPLPTADFRRITPEEELPQSQVTIDADFVLITPTLPPSKTPTQTPTITPSPSQTPSPTSSVTATTTAFFLPTSEIIPVTRQAAAPIPEVCDSTWFFIQPRPDSCPLNPPNASQGVYQPFQNGHMVWIQNQDAIYVLYADSVLPRWEVFRDYFNEGMAEESPQYANAPGPNLWQPRRGFGLLWRNNAAVRQRIGWGTIEWERPYSAQVQTANDGSIYISRPDNRVFVLMPNGRNWEEYAVSGGGIPGAGQPGQSGTVPEGGVVPLPPPPPGG